jgi:hypothetical protein
MLVICPSKRPSCDLVLSHEYFADLSPDFKLNIEAICNPNKPSKQVVDLDQDEESCVLGKRQADIIDLEQEPGKRRKLI